MTSIDSFCEELDKILKIKEDKPEQTANDYFTALLNMPTVEGAKVVPAYYNGLMIPDYYATDQGDVISLKRRDPRKLSKWKQNKGYHMVDLSIAGKMKKVLVHRLVYESFRSEDITNLVVDHIDRDRLNNKLENLRALTVAANNNNKRGSSMSVWAVDW